MFNEIFCETLRKYLNIECTNLNIKLLDIKKWDSLTHIQLMTEFEIQFGFLISFEEIESLETLDDIHNLLLKKYHES
jgi:acyl carrier protein